MLIGGNVHSSSRAVFGRLKLRGFDVKFNWSYSQGNLCALKQLNKNNIFYLLFFI